MDPQADGGLIKCLAKAVLLNTYNILFHGKIRKIFIWIGLLSYMTCVFMPPHLMMPGAYRFSVFRTWIRAYECTVRLYECVYVRTYVHTYICDPVRLRLRHLYQVEPELLRAHIFQTI